MPDLRNRRSSIQQSIYLCSECGLMVRLGISVVVYGLRNSEPMGSAEEVRPPSSDAGLTPRCSADIPLDPLHIMKSVIKGPRPWVFSSQVDSI